eukprot:m51a1_g4564 hypothetical protein (378) ;mRNA; r:122867-124379
MAFHSPKVSPEAAACVPPPIEEPKHRSQAQGQQGRRSSPTCCCGLPACCLPLGPPPPPRVKQEKVIEYNPHGLWLLFYVRGSVLSESWLRALLVGLVGVAIVLVRHYVGERNTKQLAINPAAHTFVGMALSLLLVFRTNTCYERWREGRMLLGQITNRSRGVVTKAVAFVPQEQHRVRARLQKLCVAYAFSVRNNLRKWDPLLTLDEFLGSQDIQFLRTCNESSIPAQLCTMMKMAVVSLKKAQAIDGREMDQLSAEISGMLDAWGGLQRIRGTPTPFAYAHHIKLFVHLYCFTIPFALLGTMGLYYTPLAAVFIAYVLMGIDDIAVQIEEPFGTDPNDLPVDALCRGVDKVTSSIIESAAAAAKLAVEGSKAEGSA